MAAGLCWAAARVAAQPPPSAAGGAVPADTAPPAAVAAAFFGALERHDWPAAASVVHPEAVERFRRRSLIALTEWAESGAPPDHVTTGWRPATDGVDTAALRRAGPRAAPILAGVRTVADIAALPAPEYLRRFLAAAYGSFHPDIRRHVVGQVVEGDTAAYVLVRTRWPAGVTDGANPPRVQVVYLRRAAGRAWRLLDHDLLTQGGVFILLAQQARR